MQWRNFVAIYENDDGLSRLQKTMTLKRSKDNPITIRKLDKGLDYRPMLKEINSLPVCNVIIDVEPKNLIRVLNDAKKVKLLADYCNFIITYLVRIVNFFLLYTIFLRQTPYPFLSFLRQKNKKKLIKVKLNL